MILLIAVLAVVSSAFLLFRYLRQHETDTLSQNLISEQPPQNARPLFAPTEAELQRESAERSARSIARREYRARAKARAAVDNALAGWRGSPDARHAAELLLAASDGGLAGDFARAAGEIVETFHSSGVLGLTAGDLAALLDSHYRLLPAGERSSGELFWLKEEIARLANQS